MIKFVLITCRILMTEAYTTLDMTIKYYGNGTRNGAQIPFNFELISYTNVNSTADDFKKNIDAWLNKVPNGKIANWVVRTAKLISYMALSFAKLNATLFDLLAGQP